LHFFKLGRDSGTGKFIPVKTALRKPKTTTVEKKSEWTPARFIAWSKAIRTELTAWLKWLGWIILMLQTML
jgi:hypothetical protein